MSTNASLGAPDHHGASELRFRVSQGSDRGDEVAGAGNLGEGNGGDDERGDANVGDKRLGGEEEGELIP